MRLVSLAIVAALLPAVASAQTSGVFVQGGALADIRFATSADGDLLSFLTGSPTYEWNDLNGDRSWQPGEEGNVRNLSNRLEQSTKGRIAPGASIGVGVFVSPSISLRLEGSFQGDHTTVSEANSFLSNDTSVRQAKTTTDIIVGAAWHQGSSRRVSINYLAGMVFQRQGTDTSMSYSYLVYNVTLPPATIPRLPATTATSEHQFRSTSYSTGVMTGLDVPINLSQRVALVPQVRLVAVEHEWNLRPAITIRWRP
jgi:hypothetical protein